METPKLLPSSIFGIMYVIHILICTNNKYRNNFRNSDLMSKARFPLPELTGDRFPLHVNTGRQLASGNVRPSTRPVLTGNGNRSPVNSGRQLG